MKCRIIATALELLKRNNWKIKKEVTDWSEVDLVTFILIYQRLAEPNYYA